MSCQPQKQQQHSSAKKAYGSSPYVSSPSTYSQMHQKRSAQKGNSTFLETPKRSQQRSQQGTPQRSDSKRKLTAKNCVTPEMELYVQTYLLQKGLLDNSR